MRSAAEWNFSEGGEKHMQACDFFYDDHYARLRLRATVYQIGDVSSECTPDVEREQCEDGSYATYSRGKLEEKATLQFEGTCSDIRRVVDAMKSGEILLGGATVSGIAGNSLYGMHCYVDGTPTVTVVSPKSIADIATLSLPVIIKDNHCEIPAFHLTCDGVAGVYFGNVADRTKDTDHMVKLEDCRYLGSGVYEYDKVLEFDNLICGGNAFLVGEYASPATLTTRLFVVRKTGDTVWREIKPFPLVSEIDSSATGLIELPFGDFECMIRLSGNTAAGQNADYGTPFELRLHGRKA